ncbi:hypothetical protein CBR_g54827 [Chara braunii]|uniref:Uncharacterized protein n=1 Tax=Chara braunii TaxID=69332 RepID=A0A388JPJ9_CHABU|nr:hypothetical protein CBR_g54827 [Chara braunii]|eukprot:GBG59724.1 hypothetical protein CBR_g54827 [Chara braunii]
MMHGRPGPAGPFSGPMGGGPGAFNGMRAKAPPGPAPPMFGGGSPHQGLPPPLAVMEHKLATAQTEMQRLLTENQRLAATLMALRQEHSVAQGEVQRLQQALATHQAEREASIRNLMERNAAMTEDLRAIEPLKKEVHAARVELQDLRVRCQEAEQARVTAQQQLQGMTTDFNRARQELSQLATLRQEVQQIPTLRQEIQGLRQELQQARTQLEQEKKFNSEQIDNSQRMESNLISIARENEKLRAQLTIAGRTAGGTGALEWSSGATTRDYSSGLW